ncbi:hypothetical protein Bca52824_060649 [Brassica carinata]|uniref:NYN domain-containing protein n=1 Tax=Brassica carinata TaxID=52824 RepID=A0A8X7R3Z2_BRACI|nr:hypothetical protein Bca52824_060649 [Brassica carinata]
MYRDIVEWRGQNPPPASMMIISDQVVRDGDLSWDLARLQQRTQYNLVLAYSKERYDSSSDVLTSGRWEWKKLLGSEDNNNNNRIETRIELSAMLCCKSCNFECQSRVKFRKYLSSYKHARQEYVYPTRSEPDRVTENWGRHYPAAATPEHAAAKILVWWDMFDCPIPEVYDARRVRPSIEAAFRKLGYSGPVSITAYGDFNVTPDHVLRGLTSTGVDVAHTIYDVTYKRMYGDLLEGQESNTTPTNIMVISDTHKIFAFATVGLPQKQKHKLFLAYSCRPYKMLNLLTCAKWLWHSLLEEEVSEERKYIGESESRAMFYSKLCFCDWKGPDYKSRLDDFKTHLLSEEHAQEEYKITAFLELKRKMRNLSLLVQYDREQWREANFSY